MASKKNNQEKNKDASFVTFNYQDATYQISPETGKVYRSWIELETAKEFMIFAAWKSSQQFA
ncbi:MAG: hypothetical protein AB1756_10060 [Acidobacteriota bacterium]